MGTIGVLGAGLMGAGIAEVSAVKDYRVLLKDQNMAGLSRGEAQIAKNLDGELSLDLLVSPCISQEPRRRDHPRSPCISLYLPRTSTASSRSRTLTLAPAPAYPSPSRWPGKLKKKRLTKYKRDKYLAGVVGLTDDVASWPTHFGKADMVVAAVQP